MGKNKEGKGCPESQKKEKPPFKKKLSKKSFQNGRKFLTSGDVDDEFLVALVMDLHCFVEVMPKIRTKIVQLGDTQDQIEGSHSVKAKEREQKLKIECNQCDICRTAHLDRMCSIGKKRIV